VFSCSCKVTDGCVIPAGRKILQVLVYNEKSSIPLTSKRHPGLFINTRNRGVPELQILLAIIFQIRHNLKLFDYKMFLSEEDESEFRRIY